MNIIKSEGGFPGQSRYLSLKVIQARVTSVHLFCNSLNTVYELWLEKKLIGLDTRD